jgi:hypothetical protein
MFFIATAAVISDIVFTETESYHFSKNNNKKLRG